MTIDVQPWRREHRDVLESLEVDRARGLDDAEVEDRRKRYGPNELRKIKTKSAWAVLVDQFRSLIVLLLATAAGISFVFGDWVEGAAVGAVIVINAAIGFTTELHAIRSMAALQRMGQTEAKVRRGGRAREIAAADLVPGDIVLLEGGDVVTADLRVIQSSNLQADESSLTGESVPVDKIADSIEDEDTPLAERRNMLFKGTAVTRGSGEAVAIAVGMETELGRISNLVQEAEDEVTPLEKRLNLLGHRMIWITLIIAVFVAAGGILAGKDSVLMVESAIALAVAAIPEGLPIVATLALARGMWRMARRNALVNRLSAVETLGATSVICTDKTGTLTENRMTVTRILLSSGEEIAVTGDGLRTAGEFRSAGARVETSKHDLLRTVLEVGVLCNNAVLPSNGSNGKAVGDPMEAALLAAGAKAGLDRDALVSRAPEVREEAFDSETKMMATFHEVERGCQVAVKGSPEAVLDACVRIRGEDGDRPMDDAERRRWFDRNEEMGDGGLRMLGFATKTAPDAGAPPYENLTFVGLVGLLDPPRPEIAAALTACRQAGVRVVMMTGDQAATARNIAREVTLAESHAMEVLHGRDVKSAGDLTKSERSRMLLTPVFARISPKQKLDLVSLFQHDGAIVAVTGDGVNDAPALKKADIGIAMGLRGTQVAREAADMVLKDDAFSTIVAAIEQGRVIFSNIRKFVFYLLSCNVSEVMVVSIAAIANAPLPILPLQILFLNLITDVFPALALGAGEGDASVMNRPPRDPDEPIVPRRHWYAIGGYGALVTASVLGAFALSLEWLDMATSAAVTVSFLTLAFAQLWHVFNMRDPGSKLLVNDVTRNPFIWGALLVCILLLLSAVYAPGLSDVLKLEPPDRNGWAVVSIMSLIPWAVGQTLKSIGGRETNRGSA